MEQTLVGRLVGTGTIIPLGKGRAATGNGKARRELFRSPLECFFGVRELGLITEFLQELISRPVGRNPEPEASNVRPPDAGQG